jgi:ABC-type amino acid transport substrate-binding protein
MKSLLRSLLIVVLLAAPALAQEPAAKRLKVLVKPAPPFVIDRGNGQFEGYSIDLWRRIAQDENLAFDFELVPTVPEAVTKLQAGQADVAVGAFSITAEREKVLDFTHAIYNSGLKILVPESGDSSGFATFRGLFKADTFKVIGVLLLALLANSHVLWFVERRKNPESFPEGYFEGVFEATWWSICTLVTGGCENISPKGVYGRLTAVIWMLAGVALVSYVTATLASVMTVNNLTGDIKDLDDLRRLPASAVGTVGGSAAERYLTSHGIKVRGEFTTVDELCSALAEGKSGLRAVVYDEPLLSYYLTTHPSAKLVLSGDKFDEGDYGFPLQLGSPYRKIINQRIPALRTEGYFEELKKKWFPASPAP